MQAGYIERKPFCLIRVEVPVARIVPFSSATLRLALISLGVTSVISPKHARVRG